MDSKSFKQLRKEGEISGADDLFKVAFSKIRVEEGFNERHDRAELTEHINGMVEFLRNGGKLPPMLLDNEFRLRDGHCRHQAYKVLVMKGEMDPDAIISFLPFRGTDLDAVATIASSNNGLQLTPMERSRVYSRMAALIRQETPNIGNVALSEQIAAKVGKSRAHVDQMLLLASASTEVHERINSGEVSSTEAVKIVREHGEKAAEVIEQRKIEKGGKKVTAQKKTGLLETVASAFVSSIREEDLQACLLAKVPFVAVDAAFLAELIEAVLGGDAHKQLALHD